MVVHSWLPTWTKRVIRPGLIKIRMGETLSSTFTNIKHWPTRRLLFWRGQQIIVVQERPTKIWTPSSNTDRKSFLPLTKDSHLVCQVVRLKDRPYREGILLSRSHIQIDSCLAIPRLILLNMVVKASLLKLIRRTKVRSIWAKTIIKREFRISPS